MKITKALVKKVIGYIAVIVLVGTHGDSVMPLLSSLLAGV